MLVESLQYILVMHCNDVITASAHCKRFRVKAGSDCDGSANVQTLGVRQQNTVPHRLVCSGNHQEDETAELERQYAEAAAQDQIALADMKDRTSRERTKGLAVLHQKQLWDQNLQMRILLQRCLHAANRLPYGATHTLAIGESSTLAESYAGLIDSASETIDELLTLHTALVEQHPAAQEIVSASTVANGKRNRDDEEEGQGEEGDVSVRKWRRIDEEYRKLIPFRDASIDRWHRKTMLISGTFFPSSLPPLSLFAEHPPPLSPPSLPTLPLLSRFPCQVLQQ